MPTVSGTFVASQALRGVGRLANLAANAGAKKWRLTRLENRIEEATAFDELEEFDDILTTNAYQRLTSFLQSGEFDRVCYQAAALHALEKAGGPEAAAVEGNLSGTLFTILPNTSVENCRLVAAKLMREVSTVAASAFMELGGSGPDTSPATREAIIRRAGLVAKDCATSAQHFTSLDERNRVDEFVDHTIRAMGALHVKTKMPHVGSLKNIPLENLYVAPTARVFGASGGQQDASRDILRECSYYHRVVILGDPGGGKSTTSLRLMQMVSEIESHASNCKTLPILVVLREWADDLASNHRSLPDVLEMLCRNRYHSEPPSDAILKLLQAGRITLFLDGLDELLETAARANVVQVVESFASAFPLVPIIVTSRRVGYVEAPLSSDLFDTIEIFGFSEAQQIEYARNWLANEEGLTDEERRNMLASLEGELSGIQDLARNPLLLSLICALYSSERFIPKNRPEIYQKCSRLLFETWDRDRDIRPALPFEKHILSSLQALALHMLESGGNAAGLTTRELVTFMSSYLLGRRFATLGEAEEAATDFVEFCKGRAWVLTELSPGRYSFAHGTFMEFFAAQQIIKTERTREALLSHLSPRIFKVEWDVVCQLILQLWDDVEEDGSDLFISDLLDLGAVPEDRIKATGFARRSLTFYVPSPRLLKRVAEDTVRAIMAIDTSSHSGWRNHMGLFETSQENEARWIESLLNEVSSHDPVSASYGLAALILCPHVFNDSFQESSKQSGLERWRERSASLREEWSSICAKRWLWAALAKKTVTPSQVVRDWGFVNLFTNVQISPSRGFLSMAGRQLTNSNPEYVAVSFRREILEYWDARRKSGVKDAAPRGRMGLNFRRKPDLEKMSAAMQEAAIFAAMGLWETEFQVRPRKDILGRVFSGGPISVEGEGIVTLEEVTFSPKTRRLAEEWIAGDWSFFEPEEFDAPDGFDLGASVGN